MTSRGRFVSGRYAESSATLESSPLPQLDLVPAEKLDWVLHAHHTEVAAATGDAVVNGVAEQFLGLARELGCDRRRNRKVIVLLGAQPPQAVAEVSPPAGGLRGVGPSCVDGPARVDHSGAGWHLRVGNLLLRLWKVRVLLSRRQAPVRPAMAAGDDAGAAVLTSEVDEGDHGRHLQLRRWLGHVTPDRFVTVEQLLLRPRSALEEVTEIELVARTRRKQDAVAQPQKQRMAHHLCGERRREGAGAGDLFRAGAVERLHDRVEQFRVGIGGLEDCPDFVVDPGDDFGAEQSVEDHRSISLDDYLDRVGVRCQSVNILDRGPSSHRKNAPYLGGVPTLTYWHEWSP